MPLRRDIQGLRALAVLAVIGAHAAGWPRGGFAGVDVFFVVSGFLITGMLLREQRESGRVSLGRFYARRARRLLPAAVVTIAVVVGCAFALFHRVRAEQVLGDGVSALLLVSNWRFAQAGTDYFGSDAVSPLQHFWSLSVEEQFYLVWPGLLILMLLVLPVTARRGRGAAIVTGVVAAVVAFLSFGWAVVQGVEQPSAAYFSTGTRVWEFALGAALAAATPLLRRVPAMLGVLLAVVGVAGIVASFLLLDPSSVGFPGPWAAAPTLATAAVLVGGTVAPPAALYPLTNPVAGAIGNASYSLYLWHFPVVVFAAALPPASEWSLPVILAVISVLGFASYLIVEQPLRYAPFLGGRVPPRAGEAVAAGARVASADAEAVPEPVPVSVAVSARAVVPVPSAPAATPGGVPSRRPAGWEPGRRYYPGTARVAGAEQPAQVSAPVVPQVMATPASAPALGSAPVPDPVPPAPVAPASVASAADDVPPRAGSTEAWRERFGAQITLASAGLAVAALLGVLVVQHAGRPVDPSADPVEVVAEAPTDPTGALQNELAVAVAATTWPELHPSLDEVMAQSSGANPAHDCFAPTPLPGAAACTWGSGDAPRHLYLVGDSTAMAYAPALKTLAEQSGGTVRTTTVGLYGCRFTDVLVQNDDPAVMQACAQRKDDVAAMIAADQPDLVLVSNAFTLGRSVDGRDLSAADLVAAEAAEMARYGMPGRVVYLEAPPEGASLGACYTKVGSPYGCATTPTPTWREMQAASQQAAASAGEHVVDAIAFTCWQEVCPAFAGTLPIRYDQTHLTVAYAEHIAPYLRWALAESGALPAA